MSARATAALLLQTGRIVQAGGYDGELSPAQWMALRFFARANRFSRTPSAFAEFQATTRGTATQTIKTLEASGYLIRQRLESDGRSVGLQLTGKGREALSRDPFEVLACAVAALAPQQRAALHHALQSVLAAVAEGGAHRRFGVCSDCMHLDVEASCRPAGPTGWILECRLLGGVIRPDETDLLCVKFQTGRARP
jgi:DNA-binding MarR family transcriptional regulator